MDEIQKLLSAVEIRNRLLNTIEAKLKLYENNLATISPGIRASVLIPDGEDVFISYEKYGDVTTGPRAWRICISVDPNKWDFRNAPMDLRALAYKHFDLLLPALLEAVEKQVAQFRIILGE